MHVTRLYRATSHRCTATAESCWGGRTPIPVLLNQLCLLLHLFGCRCPRLPGGGLVVRWDMQALAATMCRCQSCTTVTQQRHMCTLPCKLADCRILASCGRACKWHAGGSIRGVGQRHSQLVRLASQGARPGSPEPPWCARCIQLMPFVMRLMQEHCFLLAAPCWLHTMSDMQRQDRLLLGPCACQSVAIREHACCMCMPPSRQSS